MEILSSAALAEFVSHWIWPVFLFIFGFGAVVFVHELGHFVVAKMVGIRVERFAIGFGPRVCGIKFKGTDYSLMLLPLGGYVKMVGQEDFAPNEETKDPGAYCNKSVGARFCVIAAGVTMNVIFAAIILIGLGMHGMKFPAPVIGEITEKSPAKTATVVWQDELEPKESIGLQPGDEVLKTESDTMLSKCLGSDVEKFQRLVLLSVLSDVSDKYEFTIQRDFDGKLRTGKATIGLIMGLSPTGSGSMIPQFGLGPAASLQIASDTKAQTAQDEFIDGDLIVAVNDVPVKTAWQLHSLISDQYGSAVELTVKRGDKEVKITCPTAFIGNNDVFWVNDGSVIRGSFDSADEEGKNYTFALKDGTKKQISTDKLVSDAVVVAGMVPRIAVKTVINGSPADKAGIKSGDIITTYGDTTNPTIGKIHELSKKFAGKKATLSILRDGKTLEFTITPKKTKTGAIIGIGAATDYDNLVLAKVYPGSLAHKAGFITGDRIINVENLELKTWPELISKLDKLKDVAPKFTVQRGTSVVELSMDTVTDVAFSIGDYQTILFRSGYALKPLMTEGKSRGLVDAMGWGVNETFVFLATQYATFRSLFKGTVSTKELSGPVGIGSMAIKAGRSGFSNFAYFMAMISVALAVVNFLPIPVVDGGHALFLIIEKIRGKPLSIKVMNIIQIAGLVFIALAFIAITSQDIWRLIR